MKHYPLIALVLLFCLFASLLSGQSLSTISPVPSPVPANTDPTANAIPPAKFSIETISDQPKFSISSPILLGIGLASTLAGTILCLYSGSLKPAYDTSYATWNASPNTTTLASRDAAGATFFTPFLIGAGFDIVGVILTVVGFDQGGYTRNLTQVKPLETTSPAPTASTSPALSSSPVPVPSPSLQP